MKPAAIRALALAALLAAACAPALAGWKPDNGNGTYSNPLFYEEFSDPDMIRVGEDYYLTGTTMHAMPGLPILHSKDLVNWDILGYAFDRLDLGPDFRLEGGKEIYGQGIWAPCIRYHKGTFYIFANVNRFGLQVFRASDPRGPWKHNVIAKGLHDLSVLFDDDGKIYAVYGASLLSLIELNPELTGVVPGTERVLMERSAGMGEGSHFYKIKGKYIIVSAIPGAHTPMKCARADRLDGPWEVTTISEKESMGIGLGYRVKGNGREGPPFVISPRDPPRNGGLTLHQGGIIDTASGEWWGYSMQDHNSIGRLTHLSPVTWVDGWPYFGLPGNLTRTPRTWTKPDTGHVSPPAAPYERSDDFSGGRLKPLWQWNHHPDEGKWSLAERSGFLRLHSLPASDFWWARNTLTQRAIGPESSVTVTLDASEMKPGDVAGLALLNRPYPWIGVARETEALVLQQFDQITRSPLRQPVKNTRLWLRVHCDFDTEKAVFSSSTDGKRFTRFGVEFTMAYQLKTFQGIRYSLFHYNAKGAPGGYADFDNFTVDEPRPSAFTRPIPLNRTVTLKSPAGDPVLAARFLVVDLGQGRVALQAPSGAHISVAEEGSSVGLKPGRPGKSETFQWIEIDSGDLCLMSLVNHRYLIAPPGGPLTATSPGPSPIPGDAVRFTWALAPAGGR